MKERIKITLWEGFEDFDTICNLIEPFVGYDEKYAEEIAGEVWGYLIDKYFDIDQDSMGDMIEHAMKRYNELREGRD